MSDETEDDENDEGFSAAEGIDLVLAKLDQLLTEVADAKREFLSEVAKVRECQQAQERTLNTILIRANAIFRRQKP